MTKDNEVIDPKSILVQITEKKKQIVMLKIRRSSGDAVSLKDLKQLKRDIARLFTKLNQKPA